MTDIRIEIKDYDGNEILFQENFFDYKEEDIEYIIIKIRDFLKEYK